MHHLFSSLLYVAFLFVLVLFSNPCSYLQSTISSFTPVRAIFRISSFTLVRAIVIFDDKLRYIFNCCFVD